MDNKQISELTAATQVNNADLFVLEQGGVAKKLTGSLLLATIEAHGGIVSTSYTAPVAPSLQGTLTLTYADGTSDSVPIYNGAKGDTGATGATGFSPVATVTKSGNTATISVTDANGTTSVNIEDGQDGANGANGNPGYCWVKWASDEPTSDNDLSDVPDEWMGIYSGTSSSAPTAYTAYAWVKVKGDKGAPGSSGIGLDGNAFFVSTAAPYTQGNYNYFALGNISSFMRRTTQLGDVIFYGSQYYFVVDAQNASAVRVSSAYNMDGASVPQGGTSAQVLGKLSDSDYDIGWITAGGANPYTSNPAALGTASPGSSANFSRGDHVHDFNADFKTALLQLAAKVAYIDGNGQSYYNDLCNALNHVVTYTVTNTLTGCTSSNSSASVVGGNSYSATITASAGHTLTGATVSVTMGGTDITSIAYSNGTISIASVTGNIVISVTAAVLTLSSISAVFTQGQNVIYNSDSLNTLKQYLVVTATYSDSSTEVLPDSVYELSGSLTVGTSTITVSYGSKTDTFSVTVTSDPVYEVYTIGTPNITNNILTPSEGNMIRTNRVFSPGSSPWKVRVGFTTGNTLSSYQDVIGSADSSGASQRSVLMEGSFYPDPGVYRIGAYLSGNGTSWNINQGTVVNELVPNTTYLVEIEFTGSQYTIRSSTDDGTTWTTISTSGSWPSAINSTTAIKGGYYIAVGLKRNGVFGGTIDLTKVKVYINDTLWWSPVL